jgi:putative two-component system response regulator
MRDAIEEAVEIARRLGDFKQLRRALSLRGLIFSGVRNTADALASLIEALDLAESMDDKYAVSTAWGNLGIAFFEASLFSDARDCFRTAESLGRRIHSMSQQEYVRSRSLHGSSVCSLHLGDLALGVEDCAAAICLVADPHDRESEQVRALAEATYSHLHLLLGDEEVAGRHLDVARRMAEQSESIRARVSAGAVQALLYVRSDRVEDGLATIASLTAEANGLSASTHSMLLKTSVDVFELAGQADAALGALHELMQLNREAATQLMRRECDRFPRIGESGRNSVEELSAATKAVSLGSMVHGRLGSVLNIAITASLQARHDPHRALRLGTLARLFALERGLSDQAAEHLGLAATFCDVGMLAVPETLLQRGSPMVAGERRIVEEHTRVGAELLAQARLAVLQSCVAAARFHHERWDGGGPWKLEQERIPTEARMVAICDAFDAMIHARPWRRALSLDAALGEIQRDAGTKFDPSLVDSFASFEGSVLRKSRDLERFLSQDAHDNWYIRAREKLTATRV